MLNYSEIGILVSVEVQQLDVFHCELKRCFDSECHLETLLRIYIHFHRQRNWREGIHCSLP